MESGTAGVADHVDDKPQFNDGFQDFTAEEIKKYQKYEADYAIRLRAKYFSNKNIYGGDIFDLRVAVDDEIIKASRCSPTRSYAHPEQSVDNHNDASVSGTETILVANGKTNPPKKGN